MGRRSRFVVVVQFELTVVFRSAKERPFAERKATKCTTTRFVSGCSVPADVDKMAPVKRQAPSIRIVECVKVRHEQSPAGTASLR